MNKRSVKEIRQLLEQGHTARYVRFLGYDEQLVVNVRDMIHRVNGGTSKKEILAERHATGAADHPPKMADVTGGRGV